MDLDSRTKVEERISENKISVESAMPETNPPSITAFSTVKPSPAAITIKQQWNGCTSTELLDKIKKLAREEVEKNEKMLNPAKGKKNKKVFSSALRLEGGDVALTAFEDVRWFVLTNDPDNSYESSTGADMLLKGSDCNLISYFHFFSAFIFIVKSI